MQRLGKSGCPTKFAKRKKKKKKYQRSQINETCKLSKLQVISKADIGDIKANCLEPGIPKHEIHSFMLHI